MRRVVSVVVGALSLLIAAAPANAQFGGLLKSVGTMGARLVLKDPIDKKCTEANLKSCSDITEGLLLFAENKAEDGKVHLRTAALANSPEDVKNFANLITALGSIPGVAQYLGPVLDAARFLSENTFQPANGANSQVASSPAPAGSSLPVRVESEESRLRGGIATPLTDPAAVHCGAGGLSAQCVRVAPGPIVLSGLYEVGLCGERGLAIAADPNGDLRLPSWAVAVSPNQPSLNNIDLVVPSGQALFVGLTQGSSKGTPQCSVTWSGRVFPGAAPSESDASAPATPVATASAPPPVVQPVPPAGPANRSKKGAPQADVTTIVTTVAPAVAVIAKAVVESLDNHTDSSTTSGGSTSTSASSSDLGVGPVVDTTAPARISKDAPATANTDSGRFLYSVGVGVGGHGWSSNSGSEFDLGVDTMVELGVRVSQSVGFVAVGQGLWSSMINGNAFAGGGGAAIRVDHLGNFPGCFTLGFLVLEADLTQNAGMQATGGGGFLKYSVNVAGPLAVEVQTGYQSLDPLAHYNFSAGIAIRN